jgi:hypothetical protein
VVLRGVAMIWGLVALLSGFLRLRQGLGKKW